jgi:thiamine-monophosphate kinase
MVLRSGARPGDAVFVSGTIGDGALGLRIRRGDLSRNAKGAKHLLDRYLTPWPRTALAPVLRRYASAAIDVSDGLVGDLAHICDVSGVGAEIHAELVPLSPAAKSALTADKGLLSLILNGGDDYEVVATVPESRVAQFVRAAKAVRVAVTRIGTIVAGKGPPIVRDASGHAIRLGTKSHTHF